MRHLYLLPFIALGAVIGMVIHLPTCTAAAPPQVHWTYEHINQQLLLEADHCLHSGGFPVTVLGPSSTINPLQIRCLRKK